MTTIANRYDFVAFVSVARGNPNGDPDADNQPRTDYTTGRGIMSDVCVKRKIRNYVQDYAAATGTQENNIYYTDGAVLAEVNAEVQKTVKPENDTLQQALLRKFWDVRTFGAVMVGGDAKEDEPEAPETEAGTPTSKKGKAKGKKAKGKSGGGKVTGPVQICTALSVDPIEILPMTITRMCATNRKDKAGGENETAEDSAAANRTMGKKFIVPFGLYRIEGTVAPAWAAKTGFTQADLDLFVRAFVGCWDSMTASSGVRCLHAFHAFKHMSPLGNASRSSLMQRVTATRKPEVTAVREITDYTLAVNTEGLPANVEHCDWLAGGWALINSK
ncbi:MAG: type I CRISPR-associated protein Cas7 [Patescibacteria group bacterium]